jgi:hypothetical protein
LVLLIVTPNSFQWRGVKRPVLVSSVEYSNNNLLNK